MVFLEFKATESNLLTQRKAQDVRKDNHESSDHLPKQVVAFIDLLGFSAFTSTNLVAAVQMLHQCDSVMQNKINDRKRINQDDEISTHMFADAFEMYLPASDSVCITSSNPDRFVPQLMHLVSEVYMINGPVFSSGKSNDDPTTVLESRVNRSSNGGSQVSCEEVRLFPVLFRGGVSYGEVVRHNSTALVDQSPNPTLVLTGKAIVEAVGLERHLKGSGPRIFCSDEFVQQLGEQCKRKYIGKARNASYQEIIWTMDRYLPGNRCHDYKQAFNEYLSPSVRLYRYMEGRSSQAGESEHYGNLIKLVIRGAIRFSTVDKSAESLIDYVDNQCKDQGLSNFFDEATCDEKY